MPIASNAFFPMNRLLSYFRRFDFLIQKEEFTADDQAHRDTFVMSGLCSSIEKSLRNRIASRKDEVIKHAGTVGAQIARGKMDELADVLLEWKHLRDDLTAKHNARR